MGPRNRASRAGQERRFCQIRRCTSNRMVPWRNLFEEGVQVCPPATAFAPEDKAHLRPRADITIVMLKKEMPAELK